MVTNSVKEVFNMSSGGRMSASGMAPGNGISGSVKGRKLGYPGEGKPYMQALTKNAPHCPLHHQVTCAEGKSIGNKGQGWKMDGRSSTKPSGFSINAFVKPSNYKDPQRARKK